jgi:prolyl-tRNA synthetase
MHLVAPEGEAAPGLYDELRSAGVEVLYDDRQESPGTKFKDADLIGAPIRLTLTPRSLKDGGASRRNSAVLQGAGEPDSARGRSRRGHPA